MKIAFVNQPYGVIQLPYPSSAISLWIFEVARQASKSAEVLVYTARGRGQSDRQVHEGVEYRRFTPWADKWINKALNAAPFMHSTARPVFDSPLHYRAYINKVARDLKGEECDVVHVLNFSQFVPILRKHLPKAKIVLHMQCEWLTQLDRGRIGERLGQADMVVGCSDYITDLVREAFPQHARRCATIYNGVNIGHFCRNGHSGNGGKKRLLFVGRISPEKGVHVLLEALGQLCEGDPNLYVDIVGPQWVAPKETLVGLSTDQKVADLSQYYEGSYLDHLRRRIPEGMADHVLFPGIVPHEELTDYYRRADILVNPSLSEAFGMSLIEAMSCEVPVVASRVGGMKEIVAHGQTGYLVPPGDSTSLAEALQKILSNPSIRGPMGAAGRQRAVEQFSWESITQKLLGHYDRLLTQ